MNGPAQVCVARHGETDWNIAGFCRADRRYDQRRGSPPARENGCRIRRFRLLGCPFRPLRRALETAGDHLPHVAAYAPPVCHDGSKERNFGVIQGVPKAQLAELNPALLQQILQRNPACCFEQGESMDHFASRVLDA
ncbi:MAG: histidine phosphatase family protein [Sulfuritalea sp.]|nr:histidine phosphatase family protein [Sulfuritalea sp.]